MFYKLLGMLTWKALKLYIGQKMPTKAVVAGLAVLSLGIAVAVASAAGRAGEND
ncbi:MAG: hypothetical protein R2736_17855 [Solirubrobacterales bacterium]